MKKRKEKRKYIARPDIEPRTPDLQVRCPTDCATRPGNLRDDDIDIDSLITTYNTAVTDTAKILGKQCRRKKLWVARDVLDLFDERRDLMKRWYEEKGTKEYRKANKRVQKALMKAKEDRMDNQCKEIDVCLNKNNSKKAYQLVTDLTSEKQGRSTSIQDKSGKCLTEEQEIPSRWAEYCSELYNYESYGAIQFWAAVSTQKKIYSQSFTRKLRSQLLH